MYLVATHLGTALGTLPMFAAFVARSGSTAFADFGRAFHAGDSVWCVGLFVLGLIGFGTKAGFMPFHVWLPAAHPVAPSPVSALMSGVVIKTGIYGLLRMLSWLPALPAGCGIALVAVGMITGVMGILYALSQDQIKRMLAYSSIENIGIIGMAIGLGMLGRSLGHPLLEALGFGGALLHVLNHSLFKGLLFLSAGTVLHSTGTGRIESLGGLARRNPVNALAFLIGAVAICALPPLNGFLSEFLIYSGLLNGLIILPNAYAGVAIAATAALALIGGLALLAFSKVFAVVFLGETRDSAVQIHATPRTMSAAMMILAASCVVVGLSVRGIAPVLARVIHALDPVELGSPAAMNGSFATLSRVALPLGVFVVIVLVLGVMRLRLRPGAMAGGSGGTWGCGYAAPAARMQYTGASYAETLIFSFRHLLRPAHRGEPPSGYFPSGANIATESTDIVLKRGYEPLFARVARICERMWPLQHGRIQLYLVYIVVTVVVVFLVEAGWGSAGKTRGVAPNATKIAAVQTMPSPTPGLGEAHP
jgi:hydrogenase-4 component B